MFADRLIPAEPDQRGRRIRIQIRGRRARAAGAQAASGASAQRPAPTCPETRLGSGRPAPALEPPGPQMFASPRAGRDLGAWGPGPRGPGPGHARHPGLDYDCRRGESARRRVGPRARALRTGLAPARWSRQCGAIRFPGPNRSDSLAYRYWRRPTTRKDPTWRRPTVDRRRRRQPPPDSHRPPGPEGGPRVCGDSAPRGGPSPPWAVRVRPARARGPCCQESRGGSALARTLHIIVINQALPEFIHQLEIFESFSSVTQPLLGFPGRVPTSKWAAEAPAPAPAAAAAASTPLERPARSRRECVRPRAGPGGSRAGGSDSDSDCCCCGPAKERGPGRPARRPRAMPQAEPEGWSRAQAGSGAGPIRLRRVREQARILTSPARPSRLSATGRGRGPVSRRTRPGARDARF